jgi:hypothetical protein
MREASRPTPTVNERPCWRFAGSEVRIYLAQWVAIVVDRPNADVHIARAIDVALAAA